MSQRTTEHTLRTIVLQYDDTKPETGYEKNLVAGYVLLHDKAAELKQQRAKLLYEYQLLEDKVTLRLGSKLPKFPNLKEIEPGVLPINFAKCIISGLF